jgi:Phage tail tube protein, GTA-gp10
MSTADGRITFTWGDGDYQFRLAIGQLRELQEKCKAGPFLILKRILTGEWMLDDLRETIRLGLIGGGLTPIDALVLVKRYVDERPLGESIIPAQLILSRAIYGDENEPVTSEKKDEPVEETMMSGSPSPTFTEPPQSSASTRKPLTRSRSGKSPSRSKGTGKRTPKETRPTSSP